jgi:drug/metabolite transporter superfamily protein YnfA
MSLGTSILLIAVGAIMRFAVHVTTTGFSIHTAGTILMVVGGIGLLLSLFWMLVWSGRRRGGVVRDQSVMRERDVY